MPTIIPSDLQELVFNSGLHCTSPSWTVLLKHTLAIVLRQLLSQPTAQPRDVMLASAKISSYPPPSQ